MSASGESAFLKAYSAFEDLPAAERRILFEEVAQQRGILPAYAEKDYWVCRTLGVMMRTPPWTPKRFFKGGTSLARELGELGTDVRDFREALAGLVAEWLAGRP